MKLEIGKCYRYTNRSWLALSESFMGTISIVHSNSFIMLEIVDEYNKYSDTIEVIKVFCDGKIYYNHISKADKQYYEAL